jgi:flagellar basal-body rod protein FlgC
MMPALSSTLSALGAFEKKLAITSDNIANVNTDGFRTKRALTLEGLNGTVAFEERQAAPSSPGAPHRLDNLEQLPQEGSDVALEEEMPELVVSVYGFKANLKTLKAQDEILGTLLDIVA